MSSTGIYFVVFLLGALANSLYEYFVLGISKTDNHVVRVIPVAKQDDNIIVFTSTNNEVPNKETLEQWVEEQSDHNLFMLPTRPGDLWLTIDSDELHEIDDSSEDMKKVMKNA